jgi:hypothetical protein
MIVWPEEKRLRTEGREGLRRFRETAAAADLEASKEKWRVVAWPWTSELPLRVMLENDALDAVSVSMGEGGIWLLSDEERSFHIRSTEALRLDSLGLPAT